jgi:hypothetical protein
MERPHENARRKQAIGSLGLGQRAFCGDLAIRAQSRRSLDTVEEMQSDLARGELALANAPGQILGFSKMEIGIFYRHGSSRTGDAEIPAALAEAARPVATI